MKKHVWSLALVATLALPAGFARADEASDKATAQQIATTLRDSGKLKGFSVGVKFKDGTCWLAGRVANAAQVATALELASDVEGVEQIVNNLTVSSSAPPAATAKQMAKGPMTQSAMSQGNVQLASANQQPRPQQRASKPAPLPMQRVAQAPQARNAGYKQLPPAAAPQGAGGRPLPMYVPQQGGGVAPASYDQPAMPNYAWPSYAAYPNYAAVTYPKQYSASAWPFIGPFYPYPQVPLGWRRVSLEWDDGWWFLDFDDRGCQ